MWGTPNTNCPVHGRIESYIYMYKKANSWIPFTQPTIPMAHDATQSSLYPTRIPRFEFAHLQLSPHAHVRTMGRSRGLCNKRTENEGGGRGSIFSTLLSFFSPFYSTTLQHTVTDSDFSFSFAHTRNEKKTRNLVAKMRFHGLLLLSTLFAALSGVSATREVRGVYVSPSSFPFASSSFPAPLSSFPAQHLHTSSYKSFFIPLTQSSPLRGSTQEKALTCLSFYKPLKKFWKMWEKREGPGGTRDFIWETLGCAPFMRPAVDWKYGEECRFSPVVVYLLFFVL